MRGIGKPHGTIMFTDAFESVTWRSLSNEYWNGFTVGVEGTTVEVSAVPEPAAWLLIAGGLLGMRMFPAKQRKAQLTA